MDRSGYNKENADEFLEKVDDIQKRVEAILHGDANVMEEEERYMDQIKMTEVKAQIKEREAAERLAKGRPGRGYKGDFKTFCKGCHTEYWHEAIEICNNCGKETTPNEIRMTELRNRLEEHKIDKAKKMTRRAKWDLWKKTQELHYKKTSTNYSKWDVFESDSEDEIPEEEKDPIVPENDPQFQAMEADFTARAKKRKKNRKEANRLKDMGNDSMKRGLYKSANHYYTQALDEVKDILPIYNNRALACIKLEKWQDVVDDTTRVLEYCEVFDDGYTKQKDLCYKALSRRGQAFRAMKDYDEAIKDLCLAKILLPDQEDCQRLIDQYKEDKELARRIEVVMENAKDLEGKDYIDHLLNAVQGQIPQTVKEVSAGKPSLADQRKAPRWCTHEIKAEEATKLKEVLKKEDQDLVLYFNAKDGFRTLVQSLEHNSECLDILYDLIVDNDQLRDDFQRNHQYEALIDFMYKKNVNAEGAVLSADCNHKILAILENGSMSEAVRMNLSEKKKVKDLFLVVIKAIDINKNRKVVSSLIQFASNLCYGTGKFRRLLIAAGAPIDFITTLSSILTSVSKPISIMDAMQAEESKAEQLVSDEGSRVLLKGTTLNFIGNLCVEPQLRRYISEDMGGLLTQVFNLLHTDALTKPFDWVDSSGRALQTIVNCSLEPAAQTLLASFNFDEVAQIVFKTIAVRPTKSEEKELILRILQLLGRLIKVPVGQLKIMQSKDILLKLFVYYNHDDTNKSALITLHALCAKGEIFKKILLETHGFTLSSFDGFVTTGLANFKKDRDAGNWNDYVNVCSSLSTFVGCIPERSEDFQELIVPLIKVCSDTTDKVRKNSAVLLAKLAMNDNNKLVMQANHGTEVLCSLQNALI